MYHIRPEEDSIGVTLVAESVLLGEQVFVLDLAIIATITTNKNIRFTHSLP